MNQAQRLVLVIALGIALVIVTVAANLLVDDPVPGGWVDLTPSVGATVSDQYFVVVDDDVIVRRAAMWLAGLVVWTGASLWLLRSRPEGTSGD